MKNISISILSTVIRVLLSVGIVVIFSHSLSFSIFTYYVIGSLAAQILGIFIDAGVNNEIMRFARTEEDSLSNERLMSTSSVRLVLVTIVSLCSLIYIVTIDGCQNRMVFFSSLLSGLLTSIVETYLINLKAKNKFKEELQIVILQSFTVIAFSMLSFIGSWSYVIAILIPRLLFFIYLYFIRGDLFIYLKTACLSLTSCTNSIKNYYVKLKYYSLDSIFTNINLQMDALLISFLFGREILAIYQPLSRLYMSCISLSSAIASFAIPLASQIDVKMKRILILFFAFFISGLIISAGYYTLSGYIVEFIFGEGFSSDVVVVALFSFLILMRYTSASLGASLMLLGFQKYRANVNLITTAVCCLLTVFMANSAPFVIGFVNLSQIVIFSLYLYKLKR